MPLIRSFEDIKGWQEARLLTQEIYRMASVPPLGKDYGLSDQLRRASVSIMANIAEGFDCKSPIEFAKFLGIAHRSGAEVQSLLYVALDAGYIDQNKFDTLYKKIELIKSMIGSLRSSQYQRTK